MYECLIHYKTFLYDTELALFTTVKVSIYRMIETGVTAVLFDKYKIYEKIK